MRHRVSAFAIRHPRPVLLTSLICAIVAAAFGSQVVPHLTSQTGSPTAPSVIAEDTIRNAAGIDVTDDVVVLVTPRSGLHTAAGTARVAWVERTLRSITGIAKVQAPVFTPTVAQVRTAEQRIGRAKLARERAAAKRTATARAATLKAAWTQAKAAATKLTAIEAKAKAAAARVTKAETVAKAAAAKVTAAETNAKAAAASFQAAAAKARTAGATVKAAAATLHNAEANLRQAEANLRAAETNLQTAETDSQTATTNLQIAAANLQAAEAQVSAAGAKAKADAAKTKAAATDLQSAVTRAKAAETKARADAAKARTAAKRLRTAAAQAKAAATNLQAAATAAKRLGTGKAAIAQARSAQQRLAQVETAQRQAALQAARKISRARAAEAKVAHQRIVTKPRLVASSQLVSRDGRTAIVFAQYYANADNKAVSQAVTRALGGRSDIQVGGYGITIATLNRVVDSDLTRAELIAFALLLIVGMWVFRSVVATLVPLTIGALTIGTALLGLRIANHYELLSEYVLNIVMGVGLGLAIDYSLFIISRYREEAVLDGYGPASLQRAMDRAGRTVAFSAVTVAAALSSLLVFPQRFLVSMGIGSAITVLISAFAALVILPALLSRIGPRIDSLSPRSWRAKTALAASDPTANVWYRLTRRVIRRPVISVLGVLAIVGFALSGAFHVRFASADARTLPASYQVHSVYQQLLDRFEPDLTRQLDIAWVGSGDAAKVNQAARRIKRLRNVASVGTPTHVGGEVWQIPMSTRTGSFTNASSDLVTQIRDLPSASVGDGRLLVGGTAADFYDLKHNVDEHLPLALTIVGLVVLLIVFLMTDSVVLAVKTLLINVLNVAAVVGVLVWVFQYGHFQGLLRFTSVGAIDITQPILIIMISFALSTDYGVFLLARIKEEHDNGRRTDDAIAYGLGHVGRVITYAAILLCVALGAFATSRVVVVKEIGVGAAFAIVLDASLIRAILVPAAMKLFGPLNWWSPSWTRPLLRRIHGNLLPPALPQPARAALATTPALPQPATAALATTPALALPAGSRAGTYDRDPRRTTRQAPAARASSFTPAERTAPRDPRPVSPGRPIRTTRRLAPNVAGVARLTTAAIGVTTAVIGLTTATSTLIKGLRRRSRDHATGGVSGWPGKLPDRPRTDPGSRRNRRSNADPRARPSVRWRDRPTSRRPGR